MVSDKIWAALLTAIVMSMTALMVNTLLTTASILFAVIGIALLIPITYQLIYTIIREDR